MSSRRMRLLAALVTAILLVATAHAESETVTFEVTEFSGETVTLRAKLNKPDGDGPFPALVLLHGCDGLDADADWNDNHPFLDQGYDPRPFLDWGYVTLWIDSFGPRGHDNLCNEIDYNKVGPGLRALDAHAGKRLLADLPFVDARNIGVIGWSHGGWTVLKAVSNDSLHEPPRPDPFKAAVAFYPWCLSELRRLDAPLLILIGDADDWASSSRCEAMAVTDDAGHHYELVVYPGATHGFEWVDVPDEYMGYRMAYDPDAAEDSLRRIKALLAEHMQK